MLAQGIGPHPGHLKEVNRQVCIWRSNIQMLDFNVAFCEQTRRNYQYTYALLISLSEAASRRLRLPASAMPSSSPLSAVQVPEKPIPTSRPPKTGFSPFAGVCS